MTQLILSPNRCESCKGEIWTYPKKDGTPRKKRFCRDINCKANTNRLNHMPPRKTCVCPNCGISFTKQNKEKKTYCSISCAHRHGGGWRRFETRVKSLLIQIEKRNTEWVMLNGKRRKLHTLTCVECCTEYKNINPRSVCCSKACSTAIAARAATERNERIAQGEATRSDAETVYWTVVREVGALKRIAGYQKRDSVIKECAFCGKRFMSKNGSVYCNNCTDSDPSWKLSLILAHRQKQPLSCKCCGVEFSAVYGLTRTVCSDECSDNLIRVAARKHKAVRRAHEKGNIVGSVAFDPFQVFRRDKWKCKACGCDTPKRLRGTYEDDAPELDHIVPLSRGGWHSPDNCQTLCRRCNQDKGAKLEHEWRGTNNGQMYLF